VGECLKTSALEQTTRDQGYRNFRADPMQGGKCIQVEDSKLKQDKTGPSVLKVK
jgi:hypothetical protein